MAADIGEGAAITEAVLKVGEVVADAVESVKSKVPNLQTRPKATFSPRVNGDPGRNFTSVAAARCPMAGANCRGILETVAMGMA
jgi:hypothetical protein